MSNEFTMCLYSPRWQHDDIYTFKWTDSGWTVDHSGGSPEIRVNPDGTIPNTPGNHVTDMIDNNGIIVPEDLPARIDHLWRDFKNGISAEDVQERFDSLAGMINSATKHKPTS